MLLLDMHTVRVELDQLETSATLRIPVALAVTYYPIESNSHLLCGKGVVVSVGYM